MPATESVPAPIVVRVDPALRAELAAAASASQRTLSGEIRYLVRRGLANERQRPSAA